jgi:hypothetical protein
MYGEKKQQVTVTCGACNEAHKFFVDLEDVANAIADKSKIMRDWCSDRNGKTYLTPEQCELLCTATCERCWKVLCPDDDKAYN